MLTWARAQWDRVLAAVATVAGAVMLLVGWIGVSGTGFVSEQLPYIASEGLGGVFLLGVGGMLWLSADLRDEWRELRAIRRRLDEAASFEAADPAPGAPARSPGGRGVGRVPR